MSAMSDGAKHRRMEAGRGKTKRLEFLFDSTTAKLFIRLLVPLRSDLCATSISFDEKVSATKNKQDFGRAVKTSL